MGRGNKSTTHCACANAYAKQAALEEMSQQGGIQVGVGCGGRAEGYWALSADRACGELTSDDSFSTYYLGGCTKRKTGRGQHYLCALTIQVLEK